MIESSSSLKQSLPLSIKDCIKENILLFDKVDRKDLIQQFIHKQYLDKYDYRNPYILPFINSLKKLQVIRVKPFYNYWCTRPGCIAKKPSSTKTCKECGVISDNRFIFHYNIEINYDKLLSLIGKGIKKYNFNYKKMPKDYLGFKNASVLRINNNEVYYYILINKKGLSYNGIKELKINGLPMVIINLKGEITSTLKEFHTISSEDLVLSLISNDYSILNKFLVDFKSKTHQLKWESFEQSLKDLRTKNVSPNTFEKIVFSLFNLMFHESQRWGGPKLADGSFPIKTDKVFYLIWDAKRYDSSSLLEYIKRNALKKDLKYMEKFNKNKIIRNFGSLKYYMFVTSNTTKKDFLDVKDSIKKQIRNVKTEKPLRYVKVVCMNKNQLLKMALYVKNNYDNLMKNYDKFVRIFKRGLTLNKGYFKFELIQAELDEMLEKPEKYPLPSELRKS